MGICLERTDTHSHILVSHNTDTISHHIPCSYAGAGMSSSSVLLPRQSGPGKACPSLERAGLIPGLDALPHFLVSGPPTPPMLYITTPPARARAQVCRLPPSQVFKEPLEKVFSSHFFARNVPEAFPTANIPLNPSGALSIIGIMSKDGKGIGAENTAVKSGNSLSSRQTIVRSLQLTESPFDTKDKSNDTPKNKPGDTFNDKPKETSKDTRPPSIWHKYVTIAEDWDQRMMEKWKTNMNNLLIFVCPPHRKRVFDPNACQGGAVHCNRHFICPRRNVRPSRRHINTTPSHPR